MCDMYRYWADQRNASQKSKTTHKLCEAGHCHSELQIYQILTYLLRMLLGIPNILILTYLLGKGDVIVTRNSKYIKYCHSEDEKDTLYDKLQETIDKVPVHDVLLILGDLNSKVGSENQGKETSTGKQGCGTINNILGKASGAVWRKQASNRSNNIPTQRDSQMDVTGWENAKPDRSCHHKQQMERKLTGCESNESDHHLVMAVIKLKLVNKCRNA